MEKQFDKVVHLEKAGTLKKFISNDELMMLESLKITGKINKQDFDDVIEKMCDVFCWYDDDDCLIIEYDHSPKLRILDMGECVFEGGNMLPDFDPKILRELILPQGIEYLGTEYECSISECEDLERLVLPEGLKEIRDVFWCPKLKEVNIPLSVRKIEHSFLTTSLTEVFIHKNVEEISQGSFTSNLIKKIDIDPENKFIKIIDGVIFSADMKKLKSFTHAYQNKKYVIPNGVEEIGYMAFDSANIEEIEMPKTLKKIDTFAFQDSKLRYVEIPDSVIEIGDCAFRFCLELEFVKFSKNLNNMGRDVFYYCPKLKRKIKL
jgi:hypothetical protein